ncbi:MAG: GMP synthase [Chitinophagaceae bacterium]|jgi:GMP synthase-like glutamine amidotransferase|nr:GMP synthase [Chitinophagaceae bacterium]MBP6046744.1 GMP synthase [Ferruginibacter sp.]MBK7347442.1 GMP synthase [Chitinophagaceae bacterium]MBK7734089.1 GMP synthase [Chitinophagaceae bacterium]MBK8929209.1 GMP synthase [Chitinophagaceae bacterium]
MNCTEPSTLRVAILDLYEGAENQGMRCIREILNQFADSHHLNLEKAEFDVRLKHEVPGLDFDIYISSGGPGSPLESEGSNWEKKYFGWLKAVEEFNYNEANVVKKKVFFICHSFQLVCRHYHIGQVTKRKSTAFGVFPIHYLPGAEDEQVFAGLKDPFYAVDSRDYQVIQPNHNKIKQMGATILAIEKARPHVPYERAMMALRFNENMIGTQFHPEADAIGMSLHLKTPERKKTVTENYGEEKWKSMIEQLNDPDKIMYTYAHILPNFLNEAVCKFQPVEL